MIDTHCHLTYDGLYERVDDVIARAHAAGVDRMISVGTTPADARKAVGLARRFEGVYAAVGVHPHYGEAFTDREALHDVIREIAAMERVVALGEMGLDWYYKDPPREVQRRVLAWQLELAREIDLPIIIHNRQATDDCIPMLHDSGIDPGRFVFHCFTGVQAELDAILAFGAMVSITGIATFKTAASVADAAATIPADRLMLETDSPFLTPEPHRKVRPNEPCYVPHVATFLAQRRGVQEAELIATCDANACRFFRLHGQPEAKRST